MDWIIIAIVSIILGLICQRNIKSRFGILIALFLPILFVGGYVTLNAYNTDYSGGGASLWPLTIIFQGVFGGLCSIISYFVAIPKKHSSA